MPSAPTRVAGRFLEATRPVCRTKEGWDITFKVLVDDPHDQMGVKKGHKNQRVVAFIEGQEVGYLKWSYIPEQVWERRYPTVWHYRRDFVGSWYDAEGQDLNDLETLWTLLFQHPRYYGEPREKPDVRGMKRDIKRYLKQHPQLSPAYVKSREFWVDRPLVTYVHVEPAWRRHKVGLALYTYAARWLAKKGFPLYGDTLQTADAKGVWKKMRKLKRIPVKNTEFEHGGKPRDRIDYRRVASRFISKHACIIAVGDWEGSRCLLKVRDRNYRPDLDVIHKVKAGVELLYVHDKKTGWVEGLNEHGIGIVNTSLLVIRDENEVDLTTSEGKKLKDGTRIREALTKKTLDDAVDSICNYEGGLMGHTFLSDGETTIVVEHTIKHDCKTTVLTGADVVVRTNHGVSHEDAGYTDGKDAESSHKRSDDAEAALSGVKKIEDLAPTLMEARGRKKDPNNMVRNTANMRTTSQMLLDLDNLTLYLYLIPGKVQWKGYVNKMPKGRKPKLKLQVLRYKDGDSLDLEPVLKQAHVEPMVQMEDHGSDEVIFYLRDRNTDKVLADLILTAMDPPGYWFVGHSGALVRGQGYGTELYMAAIKYATEQGHGVVSDEEAIASAKAARRYVRRRGVHFQDGSVYKTRRSFLTFCLGYPEEEDAHDIRDAVVMTSRKGAAYPSER